MGTHYNTLGVVQTATQEEIKKSYKNLSKKYHPDRLGGDGTKFKGINGAYEVLSDPKQRRQYDLTLKYPNQRARNSAQVFEQFFGAKMGKNQRARARARAPKKPPPKQKPKNRNINHTIKVTLKEVYTGVIKKFKVKRHRLLPGTNTVYLEDKLISVRIPVGVREGRSLIIKKEGNQYPGQSVPGDIILKVIEINETPFKRNGTHLTYFTTLNLKDALVGFKLDIEHLDGHIVEIPITDIIRPGMERIIPDEGLPEYNNFSKKGSMTVRFEIEFPVSLEEEVKEKLRGIEF